MKTFGTLGAVSCFVAVLAGALGSHALKTHLTESGGLANFDLAASYMFYHGLALILLGFTRDRHPDIPFQISGWLFVFHDEVLALDSLASEQRILARCHELEL